MLRRAGSRLLVNFTPIFMPALSPSMETGKLLEWKKKVGDQITAGDVWCRLETDKAAVDFNNTADEGFIAKIFANVGDVIPVGKTIAVIVDEAADVAKGDEYVPRDAAAAPAAAAAAAAPAAPPAASPVPPAPTSGSAPNVSASGPAVQRLLAQTGPDALKSITPTGKDGRLTKADFLAAGANIDYEAGRALPNPPAPRPTFDGSPAATTAAAAAPASASGKPAQSVVVNVGQVYNFSIRDDALLAKLIGAKPKVTAAKKASA